MFYVTIVLHLKYKVIQTTTNKPRNMSTRATYQINEKRFNETKTMTFYIHHDGYFEGAASYFFNMLESNIGKVDIGDGYMNNNKGGLIEAFIRSNYNAEITESHEVHGDTEFKYTLEDNQLTISERRWEGEGLTSWKTETVSLIDFINTYHDKMVLEVQTEFNGKRIHTLDTLSAVIKDELRLKKVWEKNGHQNGRNYECLIERIELLSGQLNKFNQLLNPVKN